MKQSKSTHGGTNTPISPHSCDFNGNSGFSWNFMKMEEFHENTPQSSILMKFMGFKVLGLPNTMPNTVNSLVFLRRRRQTMNFLEFLEPHPLPRSRALRARVSPFVFPSQVAAARRCSYCSRRCGGKRCCFLNSRLSMKMHGNPRKLTEIHGMH